MKLDHPLPEALDAKRSTKGKAKRHFVLVGGRKYPMHRDPNSRVWRVRMRKEGLKVDFSTGLVNLEDAQEEARKRLSDEHANKVRLGSGGATLREICDVYLKMPKRAGEDTASANVKRLEKVVEVAWEDTLENVKSSRLGPELWEDYSRVRQGGKLDLSTRQKVNRGINSAIRMAVSIFHDGLEQGYRRAGITLDFEAVRRVQWLPEIKLRLPVLAKESIDELMKALPALKVADRAMWRAIMIARFAGLRSGEISAARPSWLVQNDAGAWCFEVRDRPEDRYWHKTGEDYTAPILSPELVEDLTACPPGELLVPVDGSRPHFFKRRCNGWLRKKRGEKGLQFIPPPNKGMHRLRALYAEALKSATVNAVLAEQAGIEAARQALGHTSDKTTKTHYLPAA